MIVTDSSRAAHLIQLSQPTKKETKAIGEAIQLYILHSLATMQSGWAGQCQILKGAGKALKVTVTPDSILEAVIGGEDYSKNYKRYHQLAEIVFLSSQEIWENILPTTDFQDRAIAFRMRFDKETKEAREKRDQTVKQAKQLISEAKLAYSQAIKEPRERYDTQLRRALNQTLQR